MAAVLKAKQAQNNRENLYRSVSFAVTSVLDKGSALRDSSTGLPTPPTYVASGDLIGIGYFPDNSLIMNCRILVHKGFEAGTLLDLDFTVDFPSVGGSVIRADIPVDTTQNNGVIQVRLPNAGVRQDDGTALPSAENGNIWLGEGNAFPYTVGATLHGASQTADTDAFIEVIFDYVKFDTNGQSYTGGQ